MIGFNAVNRIRVERLKGYYGNLRSLEVIVDGVSVGRIKQRRKEVFELPEDSRQIWGKMDWGETDRLDISRYDFSKQSVFFKGRFSWSSAKNLGLGTMPFDVFLADSNAND